MSQGGDQNLEQPVLRSFATANNKIKKDGLFDNFIFELFFLLFLEII